MFCKIQTTRTVVVVVVLPNPFRGMGPEGIPRRPRTRIVAHVMRALTVRTSGRFASKVLAFNRFTGKSHMINSIVTY